jgi:hypothetical protein
VPGASLSNLPVSWDGTVDVYVDARVWATGAAGAYVGCQLWLRSGGGGWLTSDLVESNVFAGSTRSPYMKFTIARHASGLMMGGFVTYKLSLYAQTGTCILQEAKLWVTIR